MIPFLAAATFKPPGASSAPPATGSIAFYFEPGDLTSLAMGTGDTAVPAVFATNLENCDLLRITVVTPAGPTEQVWESQSGPFSGSFSISRGFDEFDALWAGVGTYTFNAAFRRVSSGLFDYTAGPIVLTVS